MDNKWHISGPVGPFSVHMGSGSTTVLPPPVKHWAPLYHNPTSSLALTCRVQRKHLHHYYYYLAKHKVQPHILFKAQTWPLKWDFELHQRETFLLSEEIPSLLISGQVFLPCWDEKQKRKEEKKIININCVIFHNHRCCLFADWPCLWHSKMGAAGKRSMGGPVYNFRDKEMGDCNTRRFYGRTEGHGL